MPRRRSRRANGMKNPFSLDGLSQVAADLSGATAPWVKENAKILRREIRKQVNKRGGGNPSAPGQPPAKQKGQLHRSIKMGVQDGAMRVGSTSFVAPLQEFGTTERKGKKGSRGAVAPRPFMRPGLQEALPQMTDSTVAGLRKRGEEILD